MGLARWVLPWFNGTVLDSGEDEFPITRRLGFFINAGLGWGLAAASGVRGIRSPLLGATVLGQVAGNAALHVYLTAVMQVSLRHRRRPGSDEQL